MSIAVPLYGFGASGGSGGTLTVTAPANVTVTVSKDGKSKIKNSGTSGVVVFKGLASGKWNVTIVNSDGKPTTITADVQTEYTVTIAFSPLPSTSPIPPVLLVPVRMVQRLSPLPIPAVHGRVWYPMRARGHYPARTAQKARRRL